MQTNKITEEELNELEDELIYSQHQGFWSCEIILWLFLAKRGVLVIFLQS